MTDAYRRRMKTTAADILWWVGLALMIVVIILEAIHKYQVGMW